VSKAEITSGYDGRTIYAFDLVAMVPVERSRYIKTHICVAFVACPRCEAEQGEPCRSYTNGRYKPGIWIATTHFLRREAYIESLKH